ncbi:4Fe-4S binding protein [bacterium]|nr:4Fe-4S binding protein [bacterium]
MAKLKRLTLFNSIMNAFFSPPETVDYPFGEVELPDGFRGLIEIDPDKCIGCGLCVRNCPTGAITLEKTSKDKFTLSYFAARCAYCGECEAACRKGAIQHKNVVVKAMSERGGWVAVVERGEDCVEEGEL